MYVKDVFLMKVVVPGLISVNNLTCWSEQAMATDTFIGIFFVSKVFLVYIMKTIVEMARKVYPSVSILE